MADFDYRAIADRLQAGEMNWHADAPGIMALLGYEVAPHGHLGLACRPTGGRRWQKLPAFNSADDFEHWVLDTRRGTLKPLGRPAGKETRRASEPERAAFRDLAAALTEAGADRLLRLLR